MSQPIEQTNRYIYNNTCVTSQIYPHSAPENSISMHIAEPSAANHASGMRLKGIAVYIRMCTYTRIYTGEQLQSSVLHKSNHRALQARAELLYYGYIITTSFLAEEDAALPPL